MMPKTQKNEVFTKFQSKREKTKESVNIIQEILVGNREVLDAILWVLRTRAP